MSRAQGLGEEIANSVTHGIGALFAAAGLAVLLVRAKASGSITAIVAVAVYGTTMLLLYLSSTLYHALAHAKAKRVFQVFDHASIYLLIAGTYTPFSLLALGGARGALLCTLEWVLAIAGTTLDACFGARIRRVGVVIYLAMGWLVLPLLGELGRAVGEDAMWWIVAGGVFYTAGVVFYLARTVRYAHMIWHLAVIAGSVAHYVAVLRVVG